MRTPRITRKDRVPVRLSKIAVVRARRRHGVVQLLDVQRAARQRRHGGHVERPLRDDFAIRQQLPGAVERVGRREPKPVPEDKNRFFFFLQKSRRFRRRSAALLFLLFSC